MASILGALNLNDTDRVFQAVVGQDVIYSMAQEYLTNVQMEIDRLSSVFIAENTENFKERYKLPGGGRLQNMGFDPQTRPGTVKTKGSWDVAFPLASHQAGVAWTKVTMAYMTVRDMELHIQSVANQNINTSRHELLKSLFVNTQGAFSDPLHGSLTPEPLANGDTVVYPPVVGSTTEATEDHYLESGYAAANISDTNNPYVTIEADLVHHFGKSQGNDNVAVFINSAQKAVTEDLTDFDELNDRFVIPGTQTSRLTGLPTGHPGRVIGRTNGCWVIEWDWIPANYMVGVHLDTEPPLKRRVDPSDTGLAAGLRLAYEDEDYPFSAEYWDNRFGLACGNRLNGVVMELGTGGSYTIPTAYQ
jgi:hypothetical protein